MTDLEISGTERHPRGEMVCISQGSDTVFHCLGEERWKNAAILTRIHEIMKIVKQLSTAPMGYSPTLTECKLNAISLLREIEND